jgi:hypothetical protein
LLPRCCVAAVCLLSVCPSVRLPLLFAAAGVVVSWPWPVEDIRAGVLVPVCVVVVVVVVVVVAS